MLHTKVKRSAELLDRMKPGWANLVNFDMLNLDSVHMCIAGQVFREEASKPAPVCWPQYNSGYDYLCKKVGLRLLDLAFRDGLGYRAAWKRQANRRLKAQAREFAMSTKQAHKLAA